MPDRPVQHQISDRAVAKVRDVWASIGAAVEEVRRDYGEDLLVQTALEGKMDAARIWVQVKGAARAAAMSKANGKTRVRIRADLALRWARTADILVLVLWDVENDVGWYTIPTFTDLHSKLAAKGRQPVSLQVNSADLFNAESARVIAWDARLEHLAGFIRNYRGIEAERYDPDDPDNTLLAVDAVAEAVMDMMSNLKMINYSFDSGDLEINFQPSFEELIMYNVRKMQDRTIDEADSDLRELVMLCVIGQISLITGCGAPFPVIAEMSRVIKVILNLHKVLVIRIS
jgi:hypothetical protein